MDEEKKQKWALFRFQILQPLLDPERKDQEKTLQELAGKPVEAPEGRRLRLGRATLFRWLSAYRQGGLTALQPKDRKDRGTTKRIPEEIACALIRLKKEKPGLTLEALTYQARLQGILAPGGHLPRTSLYRLLLRQGLLRGPEHSPQTDRRRFEAEAPLDLVQADVMHGPKIQNKKSYLVALIDDHSRLILWAEFRRGETEEDFISVLKQALRRRGLPRRIYVDNGSAFRSLRLSYALASLGVNLLHTTPYQPEGKGKCERWFRTVRENFLPQLSLQEMESFEKLNEALWSWIDGWYHQNLHSSTGQTPFERFIQNLKASRPTPANLEDSFRHRALRKVSRDRVVVLSGKAFEAPLGSIGKRLELRFHPERPDEIEVFDHQRSIGFLKPLLVHSNAKVKRTKAQQIEMESTGLKNTPSSGQVPFLKPTTKGE